MEQENRLRLTFHSNELPLDVERFCLYDDVAQLEENRFLGGNTRQRRNWRRIERASVILLPLQTTERLNLFILRVQP